MDIRSYGLLAAAAFSLAASNAVFANGGAYQNGGGSGGGADENGNNGGAYHQDAGTSGGTGKHGDTYGNNGSYASNGDADSNGDETHDVHAGGASHLALLSGGNEVSAEGKANAGDQDGHGSATVKVDPGAGKLCFAVIVKGIDAPVAAHVHHGAAGQNGPVVVTLTAPDSGDPGTASGCVSNLGAGLLKSIKEKPWAYYINVHTGQYPDGAMRGQLF